MNFSLTLFPNRYLYAPLGVALGLRRKPGSRPPHNEVLEAYFVNNHREGKALLANGSAGSPHRDLTGLAKQTDLTERQVERWLRRRGKVARAGKTSTLTKFTESAWRCNYYMIAFSYGVYVLHDVSL